MSQWWIHRGRLLAASNPSDRLLDELGRQGFAAIVSLLVEDKQPPAYDPERARDSGWTRRSIPVPEGGTPSVRQMSAFVDLVRALPTGAKALVHCQTGGSRAGVMGAAYLVAQGLPLSEAIERIRGSNPKVDVTPERRRALQRFAARRGAKEPSGRRS